MREKKKMVAHPAPQEELEDLHLLIQQPRGGRTSQAILRRS
ncbi:hypothetical protein OVS_02355 [Mycoplasma ovis str. Michigan]|uniref:Transposase n=1 Tax=Mycoplasma ovis str. Michigan TaxID=1415773 RepID=A0ABM5P1G6_9MOLU|nr:hypothetical protein OVS_02355 [Mycoplasma ovis str. Michigan]